MFGPDAVAFTVTIDLVKNEGLNLHPSQIIRHLDVSISNI
jgi:hypothetical protein